MLVCVWHSNDDILFFFLLSLPPDPLMMMLGFFFAVYVISVCVCFVYLSEKMDDGQKNEMKYWSIVKREKDDDDDDESRVSLASSIIMIMMMMINANIVVKETHSECQSVKINMENWMDEWQTKTNQNEQFETNQIKKRKNKNR